MLYSMLYLMYKQLAYIIEREALMSKLTQQPEKVFEVHSITNVTKYVFLSDGENIIVQTHDPEFGSTSKEHSGKVQSPVKVLTDLITGVARLQIDFESTEKEAPLVIYQPTIKLTEEGD